MKLPRDLSGTDLVKALKIFGYQATRQTGSHIRLTTQQGGQHHITIPQHDPLRVGTLSAILTDVAQHLKISREELVQQLWGKREMNHWQIVKLGEVATHRKEFIDIDDLQIYKRCRVQLHVKGIVLRDEIEGARIKTKQQQVCRTNEFLVAEIDAKVGGYGIVPAELEGAIVSSHYFLFSIAETKLEPRFLGYFVKTPLFRDQVNAQGTTNYAAIRPQQVLDYTIPLPPLLEQRRIVAKIEQLAARIGEARGLRNQIIDEGEQLCRSIILSHQHEKPVSTPMEELVKWRKPDVEVLPTETYHFAGVYCFGRGVFAGERKTGLNFSYKQLTKIRSGDFIYPKLMAWEGALAVVPLECDGLYVSPEFPVFEINTDRVLPEVLDVYFRTPAIWPQLSGSSTGTNVRRRRLNPNDFLRYKFPLPPMRLQQLLRIVKAQVERLKALQAQTAAELEALLPSILDQAFKGEL